MSRLKTKRNASSYKTANDWVNAVYKQNKNFIDDKLRWVSGNKKASFKNLLIERLDNPYTSIDNPKTLSEQKMKRIFNNIKIRDIKQALDKLSRSDVLSSYEERQKKAAYETLHEQKDAFKEFRKATGWKQKVDMNKFEWLEDEKIYKYEGAKQTVYIDFKPSPKQVIFTLNTVKVKGKTKTERNIVYEWDRNSDED